MKALWRSQASVHNTSFSRPTLVLSLRRRASTTSQDVISLQSRLNAMILDVVKAKYPTFDGSQVIRPAVNRQNVHYESNVSVMLYHFLQKGAKVNPSIKPPSNIADLTADLLKDIQTAAGNSKFSKSLFRSIVATPKSYLTFQLSDEFLQWSTSSKAQLLAKVVDERPKKTLIDYASPNMAKELHPGHLRSMVQGSALVSLLRHQGHDVTGISHVGDFGTPIGLVIRMAEENSEPFIIKLKKGLTLKDEDLPTADDLSRLYVTAKTKSKADKVFASEAQKIVLQFQKQNEESFAKNAWEAILRASRKGFERIFANLGVEVEEKGESFYGPMIPDAIAELKAKGILQESDGALVCLLTGHQYPLVVRTSEGTWLYAATDIACVKYRSQIVSFCERLLDQKFDRILYVTDGGQRVHFEQVFKVAELAGWYTPGKQSLEHVPFGLVLGENGGKLSSRDGTPLKLSTLLDDALAATKQAIIGAKSLLRSDRKKQFVAKSESASQYSEEESEEFKEEPERGSIVEDSSLDANAPVIAYNAVKYFELTNVRRHNYQFSFPAMLNFRGNTAMYLIYAYARIRAVFRRASLEGASIPALNSELEPELSVSKPENILSDAERNLAFRLLQMPEAVKKAADELEPNLLCYYVYELARDFNVFYESCRILGSPEQQRRLQLCQATQVVLGKCLELLNVKTLESV